MFTHFFNLPLYYIEKVFVFAKYDGSFGLMCNKIQRNSFADVFKDVTSDMVTIILARSSSQVSHGVMHFINQLEDKMSCVMCSSIWPSHRSCIVSLCC